MYIPWSERFTLSMHDNKADAEASLLMYLDMGAMQQVIRFDGIRLFTAPSQHDGSADPDRPWGVYCEVEKDSAHQVLRVASEMIFLQWLRFEKQQEDLREQRRREGVNRRWKRECKKIGWEYKPIVDIKAKPTTAKGATVEGDNDDRGDACPAGAEHGPEVPDAQGV